MSDRLSSTAAWNRARALKLHEHFQTVSLALQAGAKIGAELERVARLLDNTLLSFPGGEMLLEASAKTLRKEWDYWNAGGRKDHETEGHVRRPESLLCNYKAGCGGHRAMPRKLIAELHRRMTLTTGGRDKNGKSPISVAWQSICRDYEQQRPLPGVDYDGVPAGAEIPWKYRTACRNKPARTVRALGNRGASAHKSIGAYVSLAYSNLRKCELFTLDDVRLDIVCIDEATGEAIEVVLYVFMEVASRMIVGYVMKPAAGIQQEDVDELLAHMLQVPGFGIGKGYTTHILFERGATACSEGAKALLEGVTEGGIKVHRTGMVGGVRWIGGPRDVARGNAAGKGVIESFNRRLHFSLLHLPGQRGNLRDNQPQNLGSLGETPFTDPKSARSMKSTLIDQAEQLAQWDRATGGRLKLKLPMLYLFQLNTAVAEAIRRHNTEPGHDYRGHGEHFEQEIAPGLWREMDKEEIIDARVEGNDRDGACPSEKAPAGVQPDAGATPRSEYFQPNRETARAHSPSLNSDVPQGVSVPPPLAASPREYTLMPSPLSEIDEAAKLHQMRGAYRGAWNRLKQVRFDLDRHALTRRVLGRNTPVAKFSIDDFRRMTSAFTQIADEAGTPVSK